jgi:hypothetical protein
MYVATFKGEKSLSQLVSRLFKSEGSGPSNVAKETARILLQANPQLANLDTLPEGSPIVIPDTPLPPKTSEVSDTSSLTPKTRVSLIAQTLALAKNTAGKSFSDALARANAASEQVRQPEFQTAAAKDPAVAERVNAIAANAKAMAQTVQATQSQLQQALAQVQQDLAKFFNS